MQQKKSKNQRFFFTSYGLLKRETFLCNKKLLSACMLWLFFFAGEWVSGRSWLIDRNVDQDISDDQSHTKFMLGRDFKWEGLWNKHDFGFNV